MNFRENLLLIIIFSGMIIQSIYQYCSINNPSFKPYIIFNKSYKTNPIYFKKIYSRFCIYSLIASTAFLIVTIFIKIELLLTSYLVLLAILVIPSLIFFIKLKYIRA